MDHLFELRTAHISRDLTAMAPGWAQPSYVIHTVAVLDIVMKTATWTGPPTEAIDFAQLPIVLLSSNC